jgi:hypothetical protein
MFNNTYILMNFQLYYFFQCVSATENTGMILTTSAGDTCQVCISVQVLQFPPVIFIVLSNLRY